MTSAPSVSHWPFDALTSDPTYFDPNDSKYRCCCQQCHAVTGVRVIAGLICVTVLMELWRLGWFALSTLASDSGVVSSVSQLLVGIFLALTIIYALWRENAAFLLPYLLLQVVGLATGLVILFALLYITLTNDESTMRSFLEPGYGSEISSADSSSMGWLMVTSCIVVIALQIWLISIVFACWRYFRDKHAYGFTKGYHSYIVLRPPFVLDGDSRRTRGNDTTIIQGLLRSVSADELTQSETRRPMRYRSHSTYITTRTTNNQTGPKLSSISYDCSTKKTVFIA
uniref:MARVEL domain-containing protein n=1 Tax=Panagrellus redivivus TaxID=6233 RepID=A0A7E4VIQ4_PANRE